MGLLGLWGFDGGGRAAGCRFEAGIARIGPAAAWAGCSDPPGAKVDWSKCQKNRLILRNADLSEARFHRTNLSASDLMEANLAGAWREGANRMRARLREANLSGADLVGARLVRAILRDANLDGARLE